MQFEIKPKIEQFATCKEFAQAYAIGEGDLVITNRYIYEPMLGGLDLKCEVIFQEEFGAGQRFCGPGPGTDREDLHGAVLKRRPSAGCASLIGSN